MSSSSRSKDPVPGFFPKPEVPKGMERFYPFFLDSQTPPDSLFDTAPIAVLNPEALDTNFEDEDHRLGGFPMTAKITAPYTKTKHVSVAGSHSADQNDPLANTN